LIGWQSRAILPPPMTDKELTALLGRVADALDRIAPPAPRSAAAVAADAYVWSAEDGCLQAVDAVNRVPLKLLCGIDQARDTLFENTRRFASALPANNALLWGARGMGKSSLVKAVHGAVNDKLGRKRPQGRLALIEIHREDIATLPRLLGALRGSERRFLVFCDDLSFEIADASFKSLKALLEGGIEGRPDNVLFYATSNRRHLMPRDMIENERSTAINPAEAVDEKVSLSDRFGLWLGFHACDQDTYFSIVEAYAGHFGLKIKHEALLAGANEWSVTRGARSGRVAWQYIQDVAGRLAQKIEI
jgi:predicted AAA+ superfamily ATPase